MTTFVDIDRGRLLDVVPGRSGKVVRDWVGDRPEGWPDQLRVATIDAFASYASVIRDTLPAATLVVDHFTTSHNPIGEQSQRMAARVSVRGALTASRTDPERHAPIF